MTIRLPKKCCLKMTKGRPKRPAPSSNIRQWSVAVDAPDGGAGVDAADRLAEQLRHGELSHLGDAFLGIEADRVGDGDLLERGLVDQVDGRAGQYSVDGRAVNLP